MYELKYFKDGIVHDLAMKAINSNNKAYVNNPTQLTHDYYVQYAHILSALKDIEDNISKN